MLTNQISSSKYLSLKTAAGLYGYTRDHLGLMIRQKKLKGIKLGSYYVTTNEWMADYVKKFSDPNHPTAKNKLSNKFLSSIIATGIRNNNIDKINNQKQSVKSYQKNTLEKELSEELSKLSSQHEYLGKATSTSADPAMKNANIDNNRPNIDGIHPYIVLPIRKMKSEERNNILKKTNDTDD